MFSIYWELKKYIYIYLMDVSESTSGSEVPGSNGPGRALSREANLFPSSHAVSISVALPFWFSHHIGLLITYLSSGSVPCSESQAGGLSTYEVMILLLIMLPTLMWLIYCDLSPLAWPHPTHWNSILGYQLLLNPSISLLFYLDNEPWTNHSETSLL